MTQRNLEHTAYEAAHHVSSRAWNVAGGGAHWRLFVLRSAGNCCVCLRLLLCAVPLAVQHPAMGGGSAVSVYDALTGASGS
jgi:hypothetical protein